MFATVTAGECVAGYRVEELLCSDAQSPVYRARDLQLGRDVALKLLTAGPDEAAGFRRRFLSACRAAASIDHPHVIPIYDADVHGELLYVSMRYVPGPDLEQLVDGDSDLDVARVVYLLSQVASALDASHAAGLVHGSLRPDGILIAPAGEYGDLEHCYVTGFGLSRRLSSLSSLIDSSPALAPGTVDYLAPEQITGAVVTPATDVYALGCVLYRALTSCVPFAGASDREVLLAHLRADPPPVTDLRPGLPSALDGVLARALAKRSDARFGTCGQLLAAVQEVVNAPATVQAEVEGARRGGSVVPRPARLRRRPSSDEQTRVAPQLQADLPDLAARLRRRTAATETSRRRLPGRRKGSASATLVASLVLIGATVVFTGGSVPVAATRAVLPFPVESHPDKGLDVSRTWVLDGERGDRLHGELIVVSRAARAVSFEEIFPRSVVKSAADVRFTPAPARLHSVTPVASYSLKTAAPTVLSYDITVPGGPVTVQRLQNWAAAQQRAAQAFYAASSAKPPVLLAQVSLSPSVVRLRPDGPPARLRITGRRTDGSVAPPADLAKAVFSSRNEAVATVSRSGVVTPVSAGRSLVTVRLGALSASVTVEVGRSGQESSSPSSASSPSAPPSRTVGPPSAPAGSGRPVPTEAPVEETPPSRLTETVAPTTAPPSPTSEPTGEPTVTPSPSTSPTASPTETSPGDDTDAGDGDEEPDPDDQSGGTGQQAGTATVQQGGTPTVQQGGTPTVQQGGTPTVQQGGTPTVQQGGTPTVRYSPG